MEQEWGRIGEDGEGWRRNEGGMREDGGRWMREGWRRIEEDGGRWWINEGGMGEE